MYSPSIIQSEIRKGVLYVTVKFSSEEESFNEEFVIRSGQNPDCMKILVKQRLDELNSLKNIEVNKGAIDLILSAEKI